MSLPSRAAMISELKLHLESVQAKAIKSVAVAHGEVTVAANRDGVAKLLEFKHLGKGTISDVGTTYKICRSDFLRHRLGMFDPSVNLEFNAHFLDRVLGSDLRLVEVPITFHPRVGESKGGNTSNLRATMVGLRMLVGITLGWRSGEGRDAAQ
jgi:hypothetical protein